MPGPLSPDTIRLALRRVGERLGAGPDIEILIVGGAAGLLTGQLPGYMTTGDVDVMQVRPPDDAELLEAAGEVGRELSLPPYWFNRDDVGLFRNTLPGGWEVRQVHVGAFGRLRVYAVHRLDLISMKFMAHRTADREHLNELQVTPDELDFVDRYLDAAAAAGSEDAGRIDVARLYVRNYRARHDDLRP